MPGFKEERVDSYELGYKGLLAAGSLRFNVAMFYSDYSDVQESILNPATFTFSVANAAASHTAGLDVEVQYAATDRLDLAGNVVVMEAEYDDFLGQCSVYQTGNGLCPAGFQDLGGHETTFAPRYSGNVKATYTQPIGEEWEITIQPDVYFTDSYFIQSDFDPFTQQEAYWLLNLRLGLAPVSGDWEVALVGKNLNDEQTFFFANDLAGSDGSDVRSLNRPRTVAIQARWNF